MRGERLLRLASAASVAVALVLIVAKAVAWLYTDSISLLASLVDSSMDAAASLISFFAIRYALAPADDEHRFGHGKAEAVAGLTQAAFIVGSATFLLLHAVDRVLHPAPVTATGVGVAVTVFAIVITGGLVLLQREAVRATGSTAIRADSLHYVGDLLMNAAIIVALLAAGAGYGALDTWFGIGIALWIAWNAWQIGGEALQHLLDREVDGAVRTAILELVRSRPGVIDVHDLRTRLSGQQMFVQMHLELDRDMPLWRAHEVAEDVELAILAHFPNSEVIVHEDPAPLPE
ncbi:MAG: cation diffusion facilitator family transporter [Pseudomonadota bacterium]